uniref:X-ray repair cross complementing protein 1 n=2 Tax=Triticum aestivum TaxID=4565 RepID=W5DNB2_WHEAT|nr:X-ray repair cross complementing protein 1 [Triticum aestivum]
MPESSSDPGNGNGKRSLPSWMGSGSGGGGGGGGSPGKKKHAEAARERAAPTGPDFSKLLDGVTFVLSGFVNPERGRLRSQALDMGAVYRPDWSDDCTLLVCAFANTPKFRQVQSENGTIVAKEWISESHSQRKLVDIEPYLMHAGNPWRENKEPAETSQDQKKPRKEHEKQLEKTHAKTPPSAANKAGHSGAINKQFSPSKIKQWAMDDFAKTISWLESQEEKPEPNELKAIAAEGVITCLQDAIESLEQGNDISGVAEQWSFVPHVVDELVRLDGEGSSLSKEQLAQLATKCKKIYQAEFAQMDSGGKKGKERPGKTGADDAQYDSDDTIEMTEEEIDLACRQFSGISS